MRLTPAHIALLAFVVYAYFMPRWADWNIDSRFDLTRAVVDLHSLRIDRYHWNTWDKAVYRGHYYSDKAPGTAVLGAAVYGGFALARSAPVVGGGISKLESNNAWRVAIDLGKSATQASPAPAGTHLGGCQHGGNVQYIPWGNRLVPPFRDWALSKYVTSALSVSLPSALFAGFLFWFLGVFGVAMAARLWLTSLYALGTIALPYSTVFYSHQLSAAFLFVAFALLLLRGLAKVGGWAAAAAGFLLGLALFTEYTVGIAVVGIGLYGLWTLRGSWRDLSALVAAGLLPVIALLVYNDACFGNPLDTGYAHDFCWSAAQGAGFAGFTYPKLGPLWDLTFGEYRGLFWSSPFLLLAAPGAVLMARRGYRLEALLTVILPVVFILAISSYWGWNGGRVDGPRYLVPVVPFLALPAVFALDHRRVLALLVSAALSLWSLTATWVAFLGGLLFPISWLRFPFTQYSLPQLEANQVAPNAGYFAGLGGWESLIPLVVLLLVLLTLFAGTRRTRGGSAGPAGAREADRMPAPTSQ